MTEKTIFKRLNKITKIAGTGEKDISCWEITPIRCAPTQPLGRTLPASRTLPAPPCSPPGTSDQPHSHLWTDTNTSTGDSQHVYRGQSTRLQGTVNTSTGDSQHLYRGQSTPLQGTVWHVGCGVSYLPVHSHSQWQVQVGSDTTSVKYT